jgi:hypothetical protein
MSHSNQRVVAIVRTGAASVPGHPGVRNIEASGQCEYVIWNRAFCSSTVLEVWPMRDGKFSN